MRKMKQPKRQAVLQQAIEDVSDREGIYGDPFENHRRVAILMNAWKEIKPGPNAPVDSIVFQIMTNLARLAESPEHKPTWDNIAGYAAIGYEVTNAD